jgi:AraC family transcriptional regulator
MLQGFSTKKILKAGPPFSGAPHFNDEASPTKNSILVQQGSWLGLSDEIEHLDSAVRISRWVDVRSSLRRYEVKTPADRYIFSVNLRQTTLALAQGSADIFEGVMPSGTLHIAGPSQHLCVDFHSPCDFIHLNVSEDYLHRCRGAAQGAIDLENRNFTDLLIRDPLLEQLARTLADAESSGNELYSDVAGQTFIQRSLAVIPTMKSRAMPKWRLKRVQAYVAAHLSEDLRLSELAKAAGLSRMYFAAQFRTSTGCRPHSYVVGQRVERAKELLLAEEIPLVQVAMDCGFQTQAHFTTVFKQWTGVTPGSWRQISRK